MKPWYIYIMANERNGTLYTGVTNTTLRRIEEHKGWIIEWFTKKYNYKICVYYDFIETAIQREATQMMK